jgi:hypothetical protein
MTDVHAEHERRTEESGYYQGGGYQQRPAHAEDYEPSDTGYDPAVDGPDDVTDREPVDTAAEVEPVEPVDAVEPVDEVEPVEAHTDESIEPVSGPEGALPEDVTPADTAADTGTPAELGVEEPDKLLARWQEVQVAFVDDPRESLRTADALVQQVIDQMQQQFLAERSGMEQQWSAGDEVSTEDMRLLLQKYRTFFNRLIKV